MVFLEKGNSVQEDFQANMGKLSDILHEFSFPLHIACSGGVDSRFLAYFAKYHAQIPTQLIHITGIHVDQVETFYLRNWAKEHAFELMEIPLDILEHEQVKNNHPRRCYYCKYASFRAMKEYGVPLCDGSHVDDACSYRPGMQALKELGIRSPLAEAGINKENIYAIGMKIGMDNVSQVAKPCLLTRFHYHTQLSAAKILAVAEAEQIVSHFLTSHVAENVLPDFRIREIASEKYVLHSIKSIDQHHIKDLQEAIFIKTRLYVEYEKVTKLSGFFDTFSHL